jgi:beta-lactamase class D
MPYLVTDFDTNDILDIEGDVDARFAPCSTFKIPLALMGFDAGILYDGKNPVWHYKPAFDARAPVMIDAWRKSFDPAGWLKESAVWYSQELALKLGQEKFAQYAAGFNYGNGDISGDAGKNNGLTHSWLSTSLQISPREQIDFLRRMLAGKLPVSEFALAKTAPLLFAGEIGGGRLFGKTGTGFADRATKKQRGWYIGWLERGPRRLLFAGLVDYEGPEFAGKYARGLMTDVLNKLSNSDDLQG